MLPLEKGSRCPLCHQDISPGFFRYSLFKFCTAIRVDSPSMVYFFIDQLLLCSGEAGWKQHLLKSRCYSITHYLLSIYSFYLLQNFKPAVSLSSVVFIKQELADSCLHAYKTYKQYLSSAFVLHCKQAAYSSVQAALQIRERPLVSRSPLRQARINRWSALDEKQELEISTC